METPIVFPSVANHQASFFRSSFTLLRRNGDPCVEGEPIAFCDLVGRNVHADLGEGEDFADDFFAVILAPSSGVVRWDSAASRGGWADLWVQSDPIPWSGEVELGRIKSEHTSRQRPVSPKDGLLLTVGKRLFDWADTRGSVLPSWYVSTRIWPFSGTLTPVTLGVSCSFRHAVLGTHRIAHEMMNLSRFPMHATCLADTLLIPTLNCLIEEWERTESDKQTLLIEMKSWKSALHGVDFGTDAAMLSVMIKRVLKGSPLLQKYFVLQAEGLSATPSPRAVVISISNEEARVFQHKELPYTFAMIHPRPAPPNLAHILRSRFTEVPAPSVHELESRIKKLASLLKSRGATLFITNSLIMEPGAPLLNPSNVADIRNTQSYRARHINELLAGLEAAGIIKVVDIDTAIALRGLHHIPDGAHGDGIFDRCAREALIEKVFSKKSGEVEGVT